MYKFEPSKMFNHSVQLCKNSLLQRQVNNFLKTNFTFIFTMKKSMYLYQTKRPRLNTSPKPKKIFCRWTFPDSLPDRMPPER